MRPCVDLVHCPVLTQPATAPGLGPPRSTTRLTSWSFSLIAKPNSISEPQPEKNAPEIDKITDSEYVH